MRFQRPAYPAAQPVAAVLIAAVNLFALAGLLFFFFAACAKPGYGIEAALVPLQPALSQAASVETIEINVLDRAHVLVNGNRLSIPELERLLGQLAGKGRRTFMLVVRAGVAFEDVSRVWDSCRRSGAGQVYVTMRPTGQDR